MSGSKHILIIRLSALGDVAMTVPVIRALIKKYPQLKITILTKPKFAPIFSEFGQLNIVEVDVKSKFRGIFGLYKLSKEILGMRVNLVADLHNVLRTNIIRLLLFNTRFEQIDKGRKEKKALIKGKNFEQLKPTIQRYAEVFDKLGYPIDLTEPWFPKRSTLSSHVLTILGQDTKRWIGVAPFAAHNGKMYPLDLMEKVVNQLEKDYKILLFGAGPKEFEILDEWTSKYENVLNLANRFDLNEELKIISNLDVMLSMDSGNAHLAAMQGVKVVTLWGVTHPYAGFYPFNQPKDNALLADREKYPLIPTSIYGNNYPQGYEDSMRTIAPEEVVTKITSILNKP